ncbi:MAG: hypothetical protein IJK02_02275 [Clostridia bacterium]|nr:hypothetical protein [Clostridia bacterium]
MENHFCGNCGSPLPPGGVCPVCGTPGNSNNGTPGNSNNGTPGGRNNRAAGDPNRPMQYVYGPPPDMRVQTVYGPPPFVRRRFPLVLALILAAVLITAAVVTTVLILKNRQAPDAAPADVTAQTGQVLYVPSKFTYTISADGFEFEENTFPLTWTGQSVSTRGGMSGGREITLTFDEEGRLTGGNNTTYYSDEAEETGVFSFDYRDDRLAGASCELVKTDLMTGQRQNSRKWCTFDDAGRLTDITCAIENTNGANGLSAEYGADGRYSRIFHQRMVTSPEFRFTYDADGRRTGCTVAPKDGSDGDRKALTYTYDGDGRVSGITLSETSAQLGNSTNEFALEYDGSGNLIKITDTDAGSEYAKTLTIEYREATPAQYRAYREISACSFDYYGFGMYLVSAGGSSFDYVTDNHAYFFR